MSIGSSFSEDIEMMTDLLTIYFTLFILFGILYFTIIFSYTTGWFKIKNFTLTNDDIKTIISVIIPARNEENNILNLLSDLKKQNYPAGLYEVIIIDDHSTDKTYKRVLKFIKDNDNQVVKIIRLEAGQLTDTYKKNAITKGIEISKGDLIVTTDADCRFGPDWLKTIAGYYEAKRCKMIIGPVAYHNETTFFEKLQSLEFLSLVAVSAGASAIGKPIMSNGANLAYEKEAFKIAGGFSKDRFSSGDDVFLMMKFRKMFGPRSISFVYTKAKKTVSEFINQRIRWASKNKGFDFNILFVSITVYFVNLFLLTGALLSIFIPGIFHLIAIAFGIKLLIDLPILTGFVKFAKKTELLFYIIPVYLIYPFYIVVSGALGMTGNYRWKDRKIKN